MTALERYGLSVEVVGLKLAAVPVCLSLAVDCGQVVAPLIFIKPIRAISASCAKNPPLTNPGMSV
jgi:hypothetical protein